jgi:hypothetical protein
MQQQIAGLMLFGKVRNVALPKLHQLTHSSFHGEKKADISGNGPDISRGTCHIDPMITALTLRSSSEKSRHSVAHIAW